MKKKDLFFLTALLFSLFLFSCASAPESEPEVLVPFFPAGESPEEIPPAPVPPAEPTAESGPQEGTDDSPLPGDLPIIVLPPLLPPGTRPELPEFILPELTFIQEPEEIPSGPLEEELAAQVPAVELAEEPAAQEPTPPEIAEEPTETEDITQEVSPETSGESVALAELPLPAPVPAVPPAPPPFITPAEPPPPAPRPPPPAADPLPVLPARPVPRTFEEEMVISRTVRATVGQIVEIPFRNTGWVYLGELANRQGLRYDSRRLDVRAGITEGQSFIFHCEIPGTYILKFYRQDFIQDHILNDHVQVIVGEASESTAIVRPGFPHEPGRVIAEPRWPPAVASAAAEAAPPETPRDDTVPAWLTPDLSDDGIMPVTPPQAVQEEPLTEPPLQLDYYIRRAREEFDAGRVEQALSTLDTMRQHYPRGSDEAWFLYGQLLEANSPGRDIQTALDYYRRLVREFPLSGRVREAQTRIAYIERFFFNIR